MAINTTLQEGEKMELTLQGIFNKKEITIQMQDNVAWFLIPGDRSFGLILPQSNEQYRR